MVITGESPRVLQWVLRHIPGAETAHTAGAWFEGLGFAKRDGRLIGGVIYFNWRGYDIEAMAAGEPGWLTPMHVKAIFHYPFLQLGCVRMTASVSRRNKISRRFVERLGFRLEGVQKHNRPDGQDAMLYGLLRTECRWIDHEQRQCPQNSKAGAVSVAYAAEHQRSS